MPASVSPARMLARAARNGKAAPDHLEIVGAALAADPLG
jgi:hypothetical protein